jgi:hypothetical protein
MYLVPDVGGEQLKASTVFRTSPPCAARAAAATSSVTPVNETTCWLIFLLSIHKARK